MHPILGWPYAAAAAAADLLAHAPLPGDSKLARSLRARRGLLASYEAWGRAHRAADRPLLWVHAPSVGEGLQARPVIQLLRARHPTLQMAYTYYSPSAERFAESIGADFSAYLPFDRRRNAERALDALRPTALVFSKLDLWPALTAAARARGIPIGMISATLSEGSARQGAVARALLHEAYGALDAVGAVDPADAERLTALGVHADRVSVTGDTRYDQVAARAAAADRESPLLAPLASRRPTLVAGSTWPADERVLLAAWRELRRSVPDARLIIAPHEPTPQHLDPIRRWAQESSLTISTLSDTAAASADVILVDRVGVLGDLYALADAAYVGGGFHAAGLHSVLEPAAFGVPVIFGPRHHKSRDAALLIACDGGESVADAPTLVRAMRIVLTEPDTRSGAGSAAKEMVAAGRGAADRSVALIEELLARAGAR